MHAILVSQFSVSEDQSPMTAMSECEDDLLCLTAPLTQQLTLNAAIVTSLACSSPSM